AGGGSALACLASISLVEGGQNFRIANVSPFASQLEGLHSFARKGERANRIRKFKLSARRTFQPGGESKNAGAKRIKAGVIPGTGWLARFWFFAQVHKFKLVIEKDGAPLADILVPFHRDNRFAFSF